MGNKSVWFTLQGPTAKRLRNKAQGCRECGYPGKESWPTEASTLKGLRHSIFDAGGRTQPVPR
jgi:hypothetical protein